MEGLSNLIISPHPADLKYAKKYNAVIPKNHSTSQILKIADVVISDVSSIIGEAAILDIPIVQIILPNYPGCFPEKDKRTNGIALSDEIIRNENQSTDRNIRPFKIAYLDEDWILGHCTKPEELKNTVTEALNEPNKFQKERLYWANQCCWKPDGNTAERISNMIKRNLSKRST